MMGFTLPDSGSTYSRLDENPEVDAVAGPGAFIVEDPVVVCDAV